MTLTLHAKTGFGSNQDNVSKLLYLHLNFALETATLFRHSLKHKSDVQTSSSAVEIHRTTYGLPSTSANPSARRSNQPTEHTCVCHNTQIRTSNSWPRISNSQTSIFLTLLTFQYAWSSLNQSWLPLLSLSSYHFDTSRAFVFRFASQPIFIPITQLEHTWIPEFRSEAICTLSWPCIDSPPYLKKFSCPSR